MHFAKSDKNKRMKVIWSGPIMHYSRRVMLFSKTCEDLGSKRISREEICRIGRREWLRGNQGRNKGDVKRENVQKGWGCEGSGSILKQTLLRHPPQRGKRLLTS